MLDTTYFAPSTLEEAVDYYRKNPEVILFAGGTDLLVGLEYGKVKIENFLDLTNVEELNYICINGNGVKIGAMTTINSVEENPQIISKYPFLADAASKLGSWQIRNTATVGGNICNGAPSAELTPPLLVLDSKVTVIGPDGERTLPLNDFLVGPGKTALYEGEILKEIEVPALPEKAVGVYMCHKWRKSMDVAIANLAVFLVLDGDEIKEARVCLGAVGPTAFRASETEKVLLGNVLKEDVIIKASETAASEAKPITDVRASADYRRRMISVCMKRALTNLQNKEV
ncbi:FAD binding domain-containing protein [Maledivibacter halophilus]|uniref:Carbon-monoxide dehydrogenase medium subunit n=1 Tax=Maledivibacter halophilus TaxID=36842 RepID=A0A1T5L3T1_9FIRM|nr:xanthine dehydrogenase family protein subunit M [Maledivibacter halophilus]SKC70641.1 carbon-monoxide dehydrogenase medium subunit [Maledivibacter halophilus]